MKRIFASIAGCWIPVGALAMFLSIVLPAVCSGQNIQLILQQTPGVGGDMAPKAGIYSFEPGTEVTLTAEPRQGYVFFRWLGDVADPTAYQTTARMDQPTIIIAVFHAATPSVEQVDPSTLGRSRGGGPRVRRGIFGAGGSSIGSAYVPRQQHPQPISVPEPCGFLLFAMGTLALRSRRFRSVDD